MVSKSRIWGARRNALSGLKGLLKIIGLEVTTDRLRNDTIRYAILTCAQKLTWVSLIYRTEPTTKKWKTEKLKSKKRICSEVSVNSPGNPWSQSWRRMKQWRDDVWWEWWVDGTDGKSATQTAGKWEADSRLAVVGEFLFIQSWFFGRYQDWYKLGELEEESSRFYWLQR